MNGIIHPDLLERVAQHLRNLGLGASTQEIEYRVRNARGDYWYVLSYREVVRSAAGRLLQVVGCVIGVN
jgi:hypothetical protein